MARTRLPIIAGGILLGCFSGACFSALVAMPDEDLSEVSAQGSVKMTRIDPCANSTCNSVERITRGFAAGDSSGDVSHDLAFTRIELGLAIEVNANINELRLGEYNRPGYSKAADILLQNISLGTIENGEIIPVEITDPYIEFAFESDAAGQAEKLAGVRLGFRNLSGTLGVNIDTLSGDAAVTVQGAQLGIEVFGNTVQLGTANIDAEGHGIRATGLPDVNVVGGTGLLAIANIPGVDAVVSALINALNGPQALDQYHTLVNNNTNNLFLSAANRQIFYPKIGTGAQSVVQPGFWLNLQDGTSLPDVNLPPVGIPPNFQGFNAYPTNCFNGNNGNQAGFSGC